MLSPFQARSNTAASVKVNLDGVNKLCVNIGDNEAALISYP